MLTPEQREILDLRADVIQLQRFLAVLVADRAMATPNPGGERKKGYPDKKSQYADPEDNAYPVDTPEHIEAAKRFLGKYKDRYSEAKRQEIKRRIDEAAKKHKLGAYREDKAQSTALDDLYEIMRTSYDDEHHPDQISDIKELEKMLLSEYNPRTQSQQEIADALTAEFLRDVRGHDYGRS